LLLNYRKGIVLAFPDATFIIKVPIEIVKRKNIYVASCPVFDVHSQGSNKIQATENIKDAVQLFLISCFERGVLDQALKECGFSPYRETLSKETQFSRMKTIDVPLYLMKSGKAPESCHV
jgi:predicted RNase H-like HicB family nuclease